MRVTSVMGVLFLLNAFGMVGCATGAPPPVLTHTTCLPMADYSRAEQDKAADELQALPSGSQVGKMVVDYGQMRAANRAACARPH
jgi:hypothetical protein